MNDRRGDGEGRRDTPGATSTTVFVRGLPSYFWLKGLIDRYFALLALIAAAPLMIYLILRVRSDSPGPALFTQTRAGLRAAPFTLYKFRTMRTDVDPYGDSPQSGRDPRLTDFGVWLRESSLDELPQLLNVVRGEMSLIGPRPLYIQQIPEWSERHKSRLLVKPGLTGLAQINGRGALTIEEKLEWDTRYVEEASLALDAAIIWTTIRQVVTRSGIYEVQYSTTQTRRTGR
ncbi:MAG: sugar transferase [Phycisphaerae bacterium]